MISNSDSPQFSPLILARTVGIVGLLGIVTGAFDIGYVHGHLIVPGDVSATLSNISAHQALFRYGFSAHLFELLLNIAGEIIFFFLIRRVNLIVAAMAMCGGIIGIAVEAVSLVSAYLPLQLVIGNGALASEQMHALAHASLQLQVTGLLISFVFYGFDELLSGFLIFRSGFLPRFIGVLLGISGFCYLSNTFLSFLAPAFDARLNPYILFACFPGEFLSSLWLATVGLNVARWKTSTASPDPALPLAKEPAILQPIGSIGN